MLVCLLCYDCVGGVINSVVFILFLFYLINFGFNCDCLLVYLLRVDFGCWCVDCVCVDCVACCYCG